DFKVGDHLYIFNHPLYKVFKPTGDWRGEHSLVFNLGNRNIKSPKGYRFGGHGMEGTLYQFYNAFLKNLKTYFTRAFVMARIHLNHMKFGASGLPAGCTFQKQAHTLQLDGQSLPSDIYKYNYEFSYKNFKKNRKRKYLKEKDFLIIQMTAENAFLINGEKDLNVVVSQNKVVNPIPFIRESVVPAGGDVYDHPEWKIVYEDVNNNFQFQPVFKKVKGKITIRHIKRRELFEAPFRYIDPIQKTVPVSQAKVDLSAAYKTFLTSNGAI
ncbi:MAG: hypothetical protein JRE65_05400, partial [Deltaproteobacteria bacterium]|nr:hypothetical protein [Deltaproteobacteria bacterium]